MASQVAQWQRIRLPMQEPKEMQVQSLGSGRSPGGVNENPIQYSFRENPTDRGTRWITVHRISKNQTRLSTHTTELNILTIYLHFLPLYSCLNVWMLYLCFGLFFQCKIFLVLWIFKILVLCSF